MSFEEIIGLKRWQKIQNSIASILGIPVRTVDAKGKVLVAPSGMPELCSRVIAGSPSAVKKCWEWFPRLAEDLNRQTLAPGFHEEACPLGLLNYIQTVQLDRGNPVYLVLGPLVTDEGSQKMRLSERIQEMNIPEEDFFKCFNLLPLIDKSRKEAAFKFLDTVFSFLSRSQGLQKQTEASGGFKLNPDNINRLLKGFLELSMSLSGAECGSVMVFEKNSQELMIKDAKGLSEDVVKETKIKPGEGIAGLTIERRKALFLNDQLNDREIRLRMRRPKVKSAFVIPVFYKNEILGVVSVGTAKIPNRFSAELMELLNELVGSALEAVTLNN